MTKISRKPVDPKIMTQFYEDFWEAIASLENKQEAKEFLFDLLTHTERKMLAKRLQIAVMLLQGSNYGAIEERLKVSPATITKINNWLSTGATSLIKVAKGLTVVTDDHKEKRSRGKYMAGDLLMPAIEEGARLVSRHLKKKKYR